MLSRLFDHAEKIVDPYRDAGSPPPAGLGPYFIHGLRQVWKPLLFMMGTGLVVSLLEVQMYRFISALIDLLGSANRETLFRDHGWQLAGMAIAIGLILPLAVVFDETLKHQGVTPSLTQLARWQAYRHVIRQSVGFFANEFAGRVAARVMQIGPAMRETLVKLADTIWYVLIYAASAIILFIEADWLLIVPLLVWMALYAVCLRHFVPKMLVSSEEASAARSQVSGRITDAFSNIQTVKIFSHAEREDAYAKEGMDRLLKGIQGQHRIITRMVVVIYALNSVFFVISAALATWLWSQSLVTAGQVTLVTGLAMRLTGMSQWIMWETTAIFDNIGTVQESLDSIAVPHALVDRAGATKLAWHEGEIRFEATRFHYGKPSGALDGIDLTIAPGEKIGLVGPSGAGKSTLVNVFLRLYDLAGGRILIDGQDIAGVTQDSLRAHIGVVTQDTSLLHRSIRENIKYGRADADDAAMIHVAEMAHAAEFIASLSDGMGRSGYDAHVGERGVKLSGGQRQRIAIARVLLKNAPILVLDEATSALDSEVEAAIQESLSDLMNGKTVIAIAHRLSTIARMDRLVVMDKGRIVETGSHAELVARGGLYARLWERQTGGFLAEA